MSLEPSKFSAFWCPREEIHIDAYATIDIEVQFLPFELGLRQCSVLFLNEDIGEFLYSIEAEAVLPLPTEVPFSQDHGKEGFRVSSALAVHFSQGLMKEDNTIVYLHCEADQENVVELKIPAHNSYKENALGMYNYNY